MSHSNAYRQFVRDPEIWRQAKERLPLPSLMARLGDGIHANKGASCPFCGNNKKKWYIKRHENGTHTFKCYNNDCRANNPDHGHNEIGYLALKLGMGQKEACKEFLRMAMPELLPPETETHSSRSSDPEPRERVEPMERDGEPKNIWHALWKKLILTADDREKIKKKRGLSDAVIDLMGCRSNNASNLAALEQLAEEEGVQKLIAEGIYLEDNWKRIHPNNQLLGLGITGEKDKRGKPIWGPTEPPLIPYLDADGTPIYLRPHKGGIFKPKDDIEEDAEVAEILGEELPCKGMVYCEFILADLVDKFDGVCVITEGEWKIAALYQCGIPAVGVPGITFIRNPSFKRQLIDLLKKYNVTDVVVMFDNEEKGDPNLAKYIADPIKRYETQVYAEYTAIELRDYVRSAGGSVKIGWLPNECRNADGKADFDGVLAKQVAERGLDPGTRAARQIFRGAMEQAREKQDLELFASESRRIIEFRLQQLFYSPKVPIGGDREEKLARRFAERDPQGIPIDHALADAFRSVKNCYYVRRAVNEKACKSLNKDKAIIEKRLSEHDSGEAPLGKEDLWILRGRRAAIYERLKGMPEPISDFVLRCEFKRHTLAGQAHRLVRVRNVNDKAWSERLYLVEPKEIASLRDFRQWGYATGKCVWQGGDKDLQALVRDMDQRSYLRDIHEIDLYGWHKESGIWFFGDVAFAKDGNGQIKRIIADPNNIFWHEGIGYQIDPSIETRGSSFGQKAPLLLGDGAPLEEESVRSTYLQLLQDMHDTIGGYEGWLAVGIMLAYCIGPELLKRGGHPGLWMYGEMSGGKTTVARWLMRIWGFCDLHGISIAEGTTPVGVIRFLSQYSCLPFWFDEFRQGQVEPEKSSALRYAFDRGGTGKGLADNSKRTRMAEGNTTPMITGETGSTDGATRSRYAQVQVSIHNRIGDGNARYQRIQEDCKKYHLIGRFLMENRLEFCKEAMDILADFMCNHKVKESIPNERLRLVHGTAYAAIEAMDRVLKTKEQRLGEFYTFLLAHGNQSLHDVMEETFLNTFWNDVARATQTRKIIGNKFFVIEKVITGEGGTLKRCTAENNIRGRWVLFVAPSIYNEYQQDKRARGENVPLDVNSLQRDLSKKSYFIPNPKGKTRTHRKKIDGHSYNQTWAISLEAKEGRTAFPYLELLIPHIADDDTLLNLAIDRVIDAEFAPEQLTTNI